MLATTLIVGMVVSVIRWTTTVSTSVVIGKVGIVVSVRAAWTVMVVIPTVAAITRSVATILFVGILLCGSPTTIVAL